MARRKETKPYSPKYEKRVILFVDFLAFKDHVARTVTEPRYLASVVEAMKIIGEIGAGDKEFNRSQRVTQFSDSVVVSFRIEESSAVFWLLLDIVYATLDLVTKGFLVRGAVTVGDLRHTKEILVGPAMVEAYELESKHANFPRVLIDEKVIAVARRARKDDHSPEEEEKHVREFMTRFPGELYIVRSLPAFLGINNSDQARRACLRQTLRAAGR